MIAYAPADKTKWNFRYSHEDGDFVEQLYNPALACGVEYCRTTGYFTADALALAGRGLAGLFANEGRMRPVVGCTLDVDEQAAIEQGYDLREQMEQQLTAADLTPPHEHARQGLELLAWMVANSYLDVKVKEFGGDTSDRLLPGYILARCYWLRA